MGKLLRFGVSLDSDILEKFDRHIKKKNYNCRSKALADLIRQEFIKEEWLKGGSIAGAITIVYNHHRRTLTDKLTGIQHDFQDIIISTQHIHLDHDNCMEIIAVKGKAAKIQKLSDILKAIKGVEHGTLSISTGG